MNLVYTLNWHGSWEDRMLGIFKNIEAAKNSSSAISEIQNIEDKYPNPSWILLPEFTIGATLYPARWCIDLENKEYMSIDPVVLQG